MSLETITSNYLNGNLTDAKRQARRVSEMDLYTHLRHEHGRNEHEAKAIAAYLKGKGTYQAACNAEEITKDKKP